MALPLVLPASASARGVADGLHGMHAVHGDVQMSLGPELQVGALAATGAHALAYLVITGLLAIVVYEHMGVRMLRSAWVNMDFLWAIALIVTGSVTILL